MALRRINPGNNPLPLAPRTFSSSSNPRFPPPPPPPSDDPNATSPPDPHPREGPNPAAASLFQGIRERLKSSPAPPPRRGIPITPPPRPSGQPPPPSPSLDDVRRSLQSFRGSRDTGSAHGPSSPDGAAPFFQNLLRDGASMAPPHGAPTAGAKTASLQGVHESLGYTTPMTLQSITDSLKNLAPQHQLRPRHSSSPFMSPDHGIFAKEQRERGGKPQGFVQEEGKDSATTLRGDYSYEELGRRLGNLRPAGLWMDGKEWFSLDELQGRIAKLVEWEKKETDPRLGGEYAVFRASLKSLDKDKDTKKIGTMQRVSTLLSSFSGRPMQEYMLQPPQEELLERYFHPDHMSSEDKMKLELQRVRDEFKMSENDCGSARVQIAQLTLKIKHLSAVLHKKDKHSRKGLQDMVQRRKKYLKYLRRTDWDSYCLVLSKLGLRDVPEYKAPDYKKTQPTTKAKSKKSKSKRKRKIKA